MQPRAEGFNDTLRVVIRPEPHLAKAALADFALFCQQVGVEHRRSGPRHRVRFAVCNAHGADNANVNVRDAIELDDRRQMGARRCKEAVRGCFKKGSTGWTAASEPELKAKIGLRQPIQGADRINLYGAGIRSGMNLLLN